MSVYRNDSLKNIQIALESLYSQTIDCDIFLQIDGEISDETRKFLKKELHRGSIKYLGDRPENLGLAESLNDLLCLVLERDYSYIARMDADDISLEYRLEKQYKYLEQHPEVDVLGGSIEEFTDDGSYSKQVHYPVDHDQMRNFFSKRVPLAHVTAMFRPSFFSMAGLYPTRTLTNEDTLLWMKGFVAGCRFANLSDVLVRVRISKDFFARRSGFKKSWSDFQDRLEVIHTLGYNWYAYFYALSMLGINLSPGIVKKFLYKKLR